MRSKRSQLNFCQSESIDHLSYLHAQMRPFEELHHKYTSYQYAYNKLVLELARRRQYREAAQRIVSTMTAQLDAMTEGGLCFTERIFCNILMALTEERNLRAEFQAEHSVYIPEDFCLHVEKPPNRWIISTVNNEPLETLPAVESDLIQEVSP